MKSDEQMPGWMITDKGRRVAMFAIRYYTFVLVAAAVVAFGAGCLAGWTLARVLVP